MITTKQMITLATLAFASQSFAECVIDSKFIEQSWKKENIPTLDCPEMDITVMNSSYKSRYAQFGRVKKDITIMIFPETEEQKSAIKRIDLSELPTDHAYSLYINDNHNLEELKIGKIKRFKQLHMKGNKLDDVRFLESITSGEIYITENIKYFPKKDSPFCEAMKNRQLAFNQNDTNVRNGKIACGIEIKEK